MFFDLIIKILYILLLYPHWNVWVFFVCVWGGIRTQKNKKVLKAKLL